MDIFKDFVFVAAQRLPGVTPGHKAGGLHGHTFKLRVFVRGDLDPVLGWVIDFAEIDRAAGAVLKDLDHRFLNEVPGLGACPSSENVCRYIAEHLKPVLPGLARLELWENQTMGCALDVAGH